MIHFQLTSGIDIRLILWFGFKSKYQVWILFEDREEIHLGNERENFVSSYIHAVRKTLKFYPKTISQVDKTLDQVASSKDTIKRENITYIGIHNRRTDHLEYWQNYLKTLPFKSISVSNKKYQELGKEYFMDAMDYFR